MKKKLADIKKDNQEEHPRHNLARNMNCPRTQENPNPKVSEEFEGRVTKKQSQEFTRTKSRILFALESLFEFLLNQQSRAQSGSVPETSGNPNRGNHGTNEDRSQNDPHPDVGVSVSKSSHELNPERTSYTFTLLEFEKKTPIGPLGLLGVTHKKRSAPQFSFKFAVKSPLRLLKQTKFCWPFNSWRSIAILPFLTLTSIEYLRC